MTGASAPGRSSPAHGHGTGDFGRPSLAARDRPNRSQRLRLLRRALRASLAKVSECKIGCSAHCLIPCQMRAHSAAQWSRLAHGVISTSVESPGRLARNSWTTERSTWEEASAVSNARRPAGRWLQRVLDLAGTYSGAVRQWRTAAARSRQVATDIADLSHALARPVRVVGRQPRDAVGEGGATPVGRQRLRGRQHGRLTLGPAPDQGPGPVRRGRDDRPLDQIRREWGSLFHGRYKQRAAKPSYMVEERRAGDAAVVDGHAGGAGV